MYDYNKRRKIGPVTILFLFLFSASIVGLSVISYLDRGRFWDILPYFCIPIIAIALILAIYNLVRRCNAGFIFILFFIVFTIGLVLSSVFGPFALRRAANELLEEKDYPGAIENLDSILVNYPNSRHAKEALQNISYAYYDNKQFPEALESFKTAIDNGVIDPESLGVIDIQQDIYFHIAQAHKQKDEHLAAAQSYQDSIEILKQIKSGFPDTNEAFIAQYKIPQYLFEASESFYEYGDNLSRIHLLEEIIADHKESDYYQEALESIDDAYVDMAMDLTSESEYENALAWFIRFLGNNPEPEIDSLPAYKIGKIFGAAAPSIIKKSGDEAFTGKDYHIAVFIYERYIEYNPDLLDNVLDNLVTSKIGIAQSRPYDLIFESVKGRYIDLPETSLLVITNETQDMLTAYMEGGGNYVSMIPSGETVETAIVPGEYSILIESNDEDIGPFMGSNILLEEYRKYSQVIESQEEGS
jgi:tetratricopeptide (TPR) repeat protein